jgi:hypothetical protein
MKKVNTELDALQLCKEHNCNINFNKQSNHIPAHVTVSLNAWTKITGKDLVEAVNRLVECYHTIPNDREKLNWWEEVVNYDNNNWWKNTEKSTTLTSN